MMTFGNAYFRKLENGFVVGTGRLEREYRAEPSGLRAVSLRHTEWGIMGETEAPVWQNEKLIPPGTVGYLADVYAEVSDDSGFTSRHLQVTAHYYYPAIRLSVRLEIWLYPDADGIRTQLFLKGANGVKQEVHNRAEVYDKTSRYLMSHLESDNDYEV